MAEELSVAPQSIQPNLELHLRVQADHDDPSSTLMSQVRAVLSVGGIDDETSVQLLRSYEERHGQAESTPERLGKFLEFLKTFKGDRGGMLDTVKNLGYLSKNLLEEHAKETGDWGPFLRRVEADKRRVDLAKAKK